MSQDERQLITQEQEMATAATLYGAKHDIVEFCYAIKNFAPWAKELVDADISLVVRRSLAMGLDPLNPHEVQIWKDNRGRVQFQLAYTLMAEWVKHFKGDHTEPEYIALSEADLDLEGLSHDCMAFYARFIMKDDISRIQGLLDIGFSAREARDALTVTGTGVATADELSQKYFAPAGRSPAWKVKKRAITDAYRRKFGTPTRDEIMELRRTGKTGSLTLEDWRVAAEEQSDDARVKLAHMSASNREREQEKSAETPEETLARNHTLLHGEDGDVLDGDFEVIADAAPPMVQKQPPQPRPAEDVRQALRLDAQWTLTKDSQWRKQRQDAQEPPEEKEVKRCAALLGIALKDNGDTPSDVARKRHSVLRYTFDKLSGSEATSAEIGALTSWLEGSARSWKNVNEIAAQEARLCLRASMVEAGQQEAELPK